MKLEDEKVYWRQTGAQDAANVMDANQIEEELGARPSSAKIREWLKDSVEPDDFEFPSGATESEQTALLDEWMKGWADHAARVMKAR